MSIIKEGYDGSIINIEISSSNLSKASYDTESKDLTIYFKNGCIYVYNNVPWLKFTQLRQSESQGKFFSKEIVNKYPYSKTK